MSGARQADSGQRTLAVKRVRYQDGTEGVFKAERRDGPMPHELLTGVRRPAGDETGIEWRGAAGGEVGFVLVHTSPRMSWTRGLSSTPDCATGRSPAPEHVS